MEKYSKSGSFGQVRHFPVPIPSRRFRSLYRISSAGWHKVNSLYHYDRDEGLGIALLLLTVSGKGNITVGGKSFDATPGSVTVIPPNYPHSYGNGQPFDWEFYWIHFQGGNTRSVIDDVTANDCFIFELGAEEIEKMMLPFKASEGGWQKDSGEQENSGEQKNGGGVSSGGELEASENLSHILNRILQVSAATIYTKSESALINKIIAYLEDHAQTEFSLDELAKHTHYSKEYIIRLFKRATGMTPYHYRQLLRLRLSCRALEESECSIGEIAHAFGYSGNSSYSAEFKKHFGISPAEYRQLYKFNLN